MKEEYIMAENFSYPETLADVDLVLAQTGAAIGDGDFITASNAHLIFLVVRLAYGADADCAVTLIEADDVAGTNPLTISATMPVYINTDVSVTNVWTRTTDAANYTIDTGDGKSQKVCFVLDPAKLTPGKTAVTVNIGNSDVANIISAQAVVCPRYPQRTMLTDLVA